MRVKFYSIICYTYFDTHFIHSWVKSPKIIGKCLLSTLSQWESNSRTEWGKDIPARLLAKRRCDGRSNIRVEKDLLTSFLFLFLSHFNSLPFSIKYFSCLFWLCMWKEEKSLKLLRNSFLTLRIFVWISPHRYHCSIKCIPTKLFVCDLYDKMPVMHLDIDSVHNGLFKVPKYLHIY